MIILFTDFGTSDPYVGQMHAAVRRHTDAPVIDLLHNVPNFNARAGAYLLDACQRQFQAGDIFVCVVDPGVGGERAPVALQADAKWYVGPDNGLLNMVYRRAQSTECFRIDWRPPRLSRSFHGRDLFAPVAARLAGGDLPACSPWSLMDTGSWRDELGEVIYIDHYGNAVTGISADAVSDRTRLLVKGVSLEAAATFSLARKGKPFWYRNSMDLVEIAVTEDSAARALDLRIGDEVKALERESSP